MAQYRERPKPPVVVEAIRVPYGPESDENAIGWGLVIGFMRACRLAWHIEKRTPENSLAVCIGAYFADKGDWIIRYENGEFRAMDHAAFGKTFEPEDR